MEPLDPKKIEYWLNRLWYISRATCSELSSQEAAELHELLKALVQKPS